MLIIVDRHCQNDAHVSLDDLSANMMEHNKRALEGLDDLMMRVSVIKTFQQEILGELFDLRTVLFYIAAIFVGYLITGTSLTYSARLPVLLLLIGSLFTERKINEVYVLHHDDVITTSPPPPAYTVSGSGSYMEISPLIDVVSIARACARLLLRMTTHVISMTIDNTPSTIWSKMSNKLNDDSCGSHIVHCITSTIDRTEMLRVMRMAYITMCACTVLYAAFSYSDATDKVLKTNAELLKILNSERNKIERNNAERTGRSAARFQLPYRRSKSPSIVYHE